MTTADSSLAEHLSWGIAQLGLAVPAPAQANLLRYLEQLHKWNKAYNLSGIRDPGQMLDLHILDSLTLLPHIEAGPVADIGTGAGLPGLPLAICMPDRKFVLIDSNSKKTRFIFQTVALLELPNVEVVHSRAQDYASNPQVAIVTSRAFASLASFIEAGRHLLADDGKFLAMKGLVDDEELRAIPGQFTATACHRLTIPGTTLTRHAIEIRHSGSVRTEHKH